MEPLFRFLEFLPRSKDKELTLLKIHLLIEEVLTKIIFKSVKHDRYILEAKLNFDQKSKIVRALGGMNNTPWIWQALKLLNQSRNYLSHSLDKDGFNEKIDKFIKHVKAHNTDLFGKMTITDDFSYLHTAIFCTYTPLAIYANFDPADLTIISREGTTILTAKPTS